MKKSNAGLNHWIRLALAPLFNCRGEAGSGDGKEDQKVTLEVDGKEKVFLAEDVKNLLAQQASATQKTQTVAEVLQAAERYGVSVDQYMQNAEGSFGVMTKLIDAGIIDEQGNVLEKKTGTPPEPTPPLPGGGSPPASKDDKVLDVAMKALVEPLVERLDKLSQDNVTLMRLRLGDTILGKFDNLDDSDVSSIFSAAERDQSKSLMQFAEERSKTKVKEVALTEKVFAKKYGVDLEEYKANQAFEQDPSGGAGTMFSGKKLSFAKGKDSKDVVTPVEATKKFFSKFDGFKA